MGEGALHAGGGVRGASDAFASLFYYMFTLGQTQGTHSGVMRQDLVGANYALIEGCAVSEWSSYAGNFVGQCRPNPDYWGALLFHRLMGEKVLHVFSEDEGDVLVFGNCQRDASRGYVLLLLNLANETARVKLPLEGERDGSVLVRRYVLTALNDDLTSGGLASRVLFNGVPLELLTHTPWVPPLNGEEETVAKASPVVSLPPLSIAFLEVDEELGACRDP